MLKQILVLVLTLLPLLHTQSLCPVLQDDKYDPCTDVCIMDMKQTLDISGQYPDYRTYLRKKFQFFYHSCHSCIYVFCGLVRERYGISLAKQTCRDSSLDACIDQCKIETCSTDDSTKIGCNQMFNCPQACKMRDLGLSKTQCRAKCQRTGQSGCSPVVEGFKFSLCSECSREGCSTWPSVQECERGCDFYWVPKEPCK